MIPIWAKDKEGRWKVLPFKIHTFKDGKQGINRLEYWHSHYDTWDHLFVYDTANARMLLKKQPTNE